MPAGCTHQRTAVRRCHMCQKGHSMDWTWGIGSTTSRKWSPRWRQVLFPRGSAGPLPRSRLWTACSTASWRQRRRWESTLWLPDVVGAKEGKGGPTCVLGGTEEERITGLGGRFSLDPRSAIRAMSSAMDRDSKHCEQLGAKRLRIPPIDNTVQLHAPDDTSEDRARATRLENRTPASPHLTMPSSSISWLLPFPVNCSLSPPPSSSSLKQEGHKHSSGSLMDVLCRQKRGTVWCRAQ